MKYGAGALGMVPLRIADNARGGEQRWSLRWLGVFGMRGPCTNGVCSCKAKPVHGVFAAKWQIDGTTCRSISSGAARSATHKDA